MQTLNLKRIVSFDEHFDGVKGIKRVAPSEVT
jgi:predicted nucleic acid-binding protein